VGSWSVTSTVPRAWSEVCDQSNALFHSEDWLALLERSFGCDSLYFMRDDHRQAAGISQFRAGPFRIGYLGFPVGGVVGAGALGDEFVEQMRRADGMPAAVRIPISGFGNTVDLDLAYETTTETAIVDLQAWDLAKINKNRRRDVNRSMRSGLSLVDSTDAADGPRLFELYRSTIERNDGSLRYTAGYFSELVRLAQRNSQLRVLLARQDESIVAFTVVALHGRVAYYLHGAFDWAMREYLPSAMLLHEAIEWSKAQGCEIFNLMSSPKTQESLIKYKERWGAESREHRTYTLPVKSTYRLFRVAERLYRLFG